MLLELIADREIAELGSVHLPLDRMASRPVAARACADLHRHSNTVAIVETGAAHLGQVPAGSEITRAPFPIGFEAATGKHDRSAGELALDVVMADAHAAYAHPVKEKLERARA